MPTFITPEPPSGRADATEAGRADVQDRRLGGAALLASGVLSLAGGAGLAVAFGWPGVLDESAGGALPAFAAAEIAVRGWFVVMLMSSVLMVPAALALHYLLARRTGGGALLATITTLGVGGAFAQTLGWVRWPLVVPSLARGYLDPTAPQEVRAATASAYDVLNHYAGGALGEHLGWMFQGLWAIGVAVYLLRAPSLAPTWLRRSLPALAIAWVVTLVPAGWLGWDALERAGTSLYSLWYLAVTVLGGHLMLTRSRADAPGRG